MHIKLIKKYIYLNSYTRIPVFRLLFGELSGDLGGVTFVLTVDLRVGSFRLVVEVTVGLRVRSRVGAFLTLLGQHIRLRQLLMYPQTTGRPWLPFWEIVRHLF